MSIQLAILCLIQPVGLHSIAPLSRLCWVRYWGPAQQHQLQPPAWGDVNFDSDVNVDINMHAGELHQGFVLVRKGLLPDSFQAGIIFQTDRQSWLAECNEHCNHQCASVH